MADGESLSVAFFGTYDVRTEPRVRVLIEGFEDAGDDVAQCNEPLGLDTAGRVLLLQRPWRLPGFALRLARRWLALWRRARRMPSPEVVVVGYLGHFDVLLARRLWPETPIVLDHLAPAQATAIDRGLSSRWKDRLLGGLDRRALRAADVPVVDTDEHHARLDEADRRRAIVVEVGAPREWFEARQRRAEVPRLDGERLRVVFVGRFTPLQGATVIGEALGALADAPIRVTMIGRGQDLEAARAAADGARNVTWLDWLDPTPPSLVAVHDVSLGIFGTTEKAQLVVPNKVFQGAAAGCAIVTSDTVPQRRALADAATYVPPGDPDALQRTLRRLAADPEEVAELRRRASELADRRFRPERTVAPLRDRLRQPRAPT